MITYKRYLENTAKSKNVRFLLIEKLGCLKGMRTLSLETEVMPKKQREKWMGGKLMQM